MDVDCAPDGLAPPLPYEMKPLRGLEVLGRAGWGTTLLVDPRSLLDRCGAPGPAPAIQATRLLGVRHLAEAVLLSIRPSVRTRRVSAAIDLTHAASMAVLAAAAPRYRRAAAVSLSVSSALAAAALLSG